MIDKAKDIKPAFEEFVLAPLGNACSHHTIWRELHRGDDFDDKQAERIEGHLKKKARAREKVTLEYKGDFRFVRWEFFSRPLPTKVLFVQEIKRPIAGLCIVP